MAVVVLVLASGRGERFVASGGQGSKLAADLCGRPVLQRTLDAVRASGLRWHLEDRGHPGMGDSIAAAVAATADAQAWLVLPGDLALIQADTLRQVAQYPSTGDRVVLPTYRGERGHPVRFPSGALAALLALRGVSGAASVLRGLPGVDLVPVDDPGCVMDIDTVDQLGAARKAWLQRVVSHKK